jgi:hypothetical protein
MDTGTSLIMGPPQAVREFYSSIPGAYELSGPSAGQFSVPCNTANLGLAFTINGHKYSVRDSDFVINAGYFCIGGVALLNSWPFGDDWLLGDVFLKNVYSAYRHSPVPAVGLAPSI